MGYGSASGSQERTIAINDKLKSQITLPPLVVLFDLFFLVIIGCGQVIKV